MNNLKNSIWWWLGLKRPFIINNEYRLDLLYIDRENNSVKIRITNLKDGSVVENEVENEY